MENIAFRKVDITDGFWKQKQELNRKATIYSVWERFKETGRFDAFQFNWKEGMPNKPHIFWESDIAKWIEAVAYILEKEPDPSLENAVEEIIDCIEQHQDENGYFNIYFTVCEPESRFTRRTDHELYCAGHLIEAAVAYYESTGKDRFLKLMCKYADHIEQVFMMEQSANFVTPGHEEIELALVKLYHCTGKEKYLSLSKFFIDQRGANEKDKINHYNFASPSCDQSHLPAVEQETAEGHSVRACYLYSAMADLSKELKDEMLLSACKKLFANISERRMYITGGIGQSSLGEAFTIDYDLPNKTAYSETCAAISLAMFSHRMLNIEANSVYADVIERVLYNGMLSGLSLDGKSFFYENPLEIDPALKDKDASVVKERRPHYPITQRVEVFNCSCCPPNVNRFLASVGDYIYSKHQETYFIHQFINSEVIEDDIRIIQTTDYPNSGKVTLKTNGIQKLAVRIPGWCTDYSINADFTLKDGYAYLDNINGDIEICFDMKPTLIQASPFVQENCGRVALQNGPIIYCLEEVDNGKNLRNVYLKESFNPTVTYNSYFGTNTITAEGYRQCETNQLYSPWTNKADKVKLKFIPYFAFANRGESEMIVWISVK